jgi:hypothetical protein
LTRIKRAPIAGVMMPLCRMEDIMRKVTARAVARPINQHILATEWSLALWMLAVAFLLTTFQVY